MESSAASGNDFLIQYRNVSSKLKKRFLRKPNVAEASEQFGQLSRQLCEGEAWAQAGLCCIAVAKCEQTLANPSTEVAAIIQAARNYLKAEQVNRHLLCPSFNEHLMTATSCYQHAIRLYMEQKKAIPAAALSHEIGQALRDLNRPSEALAHLKAAVSMQSGFPLGQLQCLGTLASCHIDQGDLDSALGVFMEMNKIVEQNSGQLLMGAYRDIAARCEISSLLILLTLQPLPQRIKPNHAQLLEKYSWTSHDNQHPQAMQEPSTNLPAGQHHLHSPVPYDDEELLVLLQSLVLACQGRDTRALAALSQHLTHLLQPEHVQLLHILVTELNRS